MTGGLSILMPSYNNTCVQTAQALAAQCRAAAGLDYEILVADDGSEDRKVIEENRRINAIAGCRYLERESNTGRAAIRNFLTRHAKYKRLLYIDSDAAIRNDNYIQNYLHTECKGIVHGGIHNLPDSRGRNSLRYRYEHSRERKLSTKRRNKSPYRSFGTANFMALREIMLQFPFDEHFKEYGYEDVLFGKTLKENGIPVFYIDNPVVIDDFEENGRFVEKTETALRTLHKFSREIDGYSGIIEADKILKKWHLGGLLQSIYRRHGQKMRDKLCRKRPCLFRYNCYRMLYYSGLSAQ